MRTFQRICVYCGSQSGRNVYVEAAQAMGRFLAEHGIGIVYGGGRIGLMGVLADAALTAGGEVHGVIPEKLLDLELGHTGLTSLHVTRGMHERKLKMAELSDGFVAMPGGYGTMEELLEVTTWSQLNYHHKPVGVLNVAGYFDPLLAFVAHACEEGFVRTIHRELIVAAPTPQELLQRLQTAEIPELRQWISEV